MKLARKTPNLYLERIPLRFLFVKQRKAGSGIETVPGQRLMPYLVPMARPILTSVHYQRHPNGRGSTSHYDADRHFNQACGYEIPGTDKSTQVVEPYFVTATPLSKNDVYQLRSGFIISAKTVLPISTHLKQSERGGGRLRA
jgi:hypothetical protein